MKSSRKSSTQNPQTGPNQTGLNRFKPVQTGPTNRTNQSKPVQTGPNRSKPVQILDYVS